MWDALIVAARLLQYGGGCVLFGASVFQLLNAPTSDVIPRHWLSRTFVLSAAAVMTGALLWLFAQCGTMADIPLREMGLSDYTSVAFFTSFGRVCVARLALALLCFPLAFITGNRSTSVARGVISSALLASFAWTGHGSMTGSIHLGADILHLLAAGLWLGALVPLVALIVRANHTSSASDKELTCRTLERFAFVGSVSVLLLIATGLINTWYVIGPAHILRAWETTYGQTLIAKIVIFIGMLALAVTHRFYMTPALAGSLADRERSAQALSRLRRSVVFEAVLGILVLLTVAWLGTLDPSGKGDLDGSRSSGSVVHNS